MIATAGLLGSAHCVGMCGGFALLIGAHTPNWKYNLLRQLVYSLGRISTYTLLGAVCGYAGWRLARGTSSLIAVQTWLAVVAGVLLIVQGLLATGIIARAVPHKAGGCWQPKLLATYLRGKGWKNVYLAGVCTGFLPCGLVYAFLALAGASGSMLGGSLRMSLFGLGTVPLMVLTGWSGSLLSWPKRHKTLQFAGWCVLLTGVLSVARAVGFMDGVVGADHAGCIFCR